MSHLKGLKKMDDDLRILTARTVAFDLLLRAFYAKWASLEPDPRAFLTIQIETIIGSMDAVKNRPKTDADRRTWERAEVELRAFLKNVLGRFPEPTQH
jgi:hypothetical protein